MVIHRLEKNVEAWKNFHSPRKRDWKPWELACRNRG